MPMCGGNQCDMSCKRCEMIRELLLIAVHSSDTSCGSVSTATDWSATNLSSARIHDLQNQLNIQLRMKLHTSSIVFFARSTHARIE